VRTFPAYAVALSAGRRNAGRDLHLRRFRAPSQTGAPGPFPHATRKLTRLRGLVCARPLHRAGLPARGTDRSYQLTSFLLKSKPFSRTISWCKEKGFFRSSYSGLTRFVLATAFCSSWQTVCVRVASRREHKQF